MSKPTAEDMLGSSARRAQRRLNTALGPIMKGIRIAEDLRAGWRIVLLLAVGQIGGMVIVYAIGEPHSTTLIPAMPADELRRTIGASVGTAVGFSAGLLWQMLASPATTPVALTRFLALLATLLLIPGVAFLLTSAEAP